MAAKKDTKTEGRAEFGVDPTTGAKVIESLVERGDVSALSPSERAKYYVQMCEGLGLNPHAQPFAFLRLNGKEVLYATRGATDQLAAKHRLNREITDGPKVIDLAGTKLVYAVCKATLPDGRFETATATLPLADPLNVLMKVETKAKRRATLSILGLGILDETEIDTIQGAEVTQDGERVIDLNADVSPTPSPAVTSSEPPALVRAFEERLGAIALVDDAVDLWLEYRGPLEALGPSVVESARNALVRATEVQTQVKNARVVLRKAIQAREQSGG